MPFDTLAMAAAADEIGSVVHAQIQKILQPSASAVALSLYGEGRQQWLVLSADPRYAHVSLTEGKVAKAFATPSSFVMLLRKYLEGVRIANVAQVHEERILHVTCGSGERETRLIVEVMGKHSNVILVDPVYTILGALKIIPPRLSRVRPIIPGQMYQAPPVRGRDEEIFSPGERIDPSIQPEELRLLLDQAPASTPLGYALLGLLPGASTFLAGQIALSAGLDSKSPLGETALPRVVQVCQSFYDLYRTRAWRPTVFVDVRDRADIAPYKPIGVRDPQEMESMSAAIQLVLGAGESRDSLATSRKVILAEIDRARHGASGRLKSLLKGLEASGEAEIVKERGQLILAYQWAATPRASELRIPDLDMVIPLDPERTATQNAEQVFRRYQKLRDAAVRIPGLLTAAQTELTRLDELITFVLLADSEGALADLRRELRPDDLQVQKPSPRRSRRGPRRFRHITGFIAVAGRSARENEEVTFHLAGGEDLWLHARERTGSHVLLQIRQVAPSDEVVAAAARRAAYFSEGRDDSAVDVDVAPVREVRRVSGGLPGRVTFRKSRTFRVAPSLEEWRQETNS